MTCDPTSAPVRLEGPDIPDLVAARPLEERARAAARAQAWYQAALTRLKLDIVSRGAGAARADQMSGPEARRAFARTLTLYRTVSELLVALLAVGRRAGVRRIRYYHYDPEAECLTSVDCAGHRSDEALRLRLGSISKSRRACPPEESGSYVCLDRRVPILFEVDPSAAEPMTDQGTVGELPLVLMSGGQCDLILGNSPYRYRVDYPLVRGRRVIGKLSCDLAVGMPTPQLTRRLVRFGRLAAQIAAPIEGLRAERLAADIRVTDGVRDAVRGAASLRELYDLCVGYLPRRLDVRHASLFTVTTDAAGSTHLVLRRTSYPGSRPLEDGARDDRGRVGYYQLGPDPDDSITAWVARHHRPARLQRLGDDAFRTAQLGALDPNLRWRNRIQDSDTHVSFLAVPVVVSGRLLGVLRFTEKAAGDERAYFNDMDERCLLRIATDHLGPRLAELQVREAQDRFCDPAWQRPVVKALAETFEPAGDDQTDRRRRLNFRKAMRGLFRDDDRSPQPYVARHLYLAGHFPAAGGRFRHLARVGPLADRVGDRPGESDARVRDRLDKLAGRAIRDDRCVFLHASSEIQHRQPGNRLVGGTACVLACPIHLGQTMGRGAIVLYSDRQDLQPEVHGQLLESLARLTGDILTCQLRTRRARP